MAKFKAGDMITAKVQGGHRVYMVNKVFISDHTFTRGLEMYSLDDGNGFIDAIDSARNIDAEFKLCD